MTFVPGSTCTHRVRSKGQYEVVEDSGVGSLVKVRRSGQEGKDFWVPRVDLIGPDAPPEIYSYAEAFLNYEATPRFLHRIGDDGYVLIARVATEDQLIQAEAEYRTWSNGDELTDTEVYWRKREKRLDRNEAYNREWRLTFHLKPNMCGPFPLRPIGTAQLEHIDNHKPENAAGILYPTGRVELNWVATIKELISMGLRARGGRLH